MKKIEAFNASTVCAKAKDHGDGSGRSQKELKWNKKDEQDYEDDEYISWNGSLYALKCRIGAREDPQGMDKGKAGIGETRGALREGMNQETRFGVKLESNMDE
nr:hypothetical protein [Tanacetum cinerariifolium]